MSSPLTIGIAGAGVLGRLLAWVTSRAGHRVTVFDPASGPDPLASGVLRENPSHYAAGFTAAGMLSPVAELDNSEPQVAVWGRRSLVLWRQITQLLTEGGCQAPLFKQMGSLMLSHGSDLGAARRVLARLNAIETTSLGLPMPIELDRESLLALEPDILPTLNAWLLPDEGQLMPRDVLLELARQALDVQWRWSSLVSHTAAHRIALQDAPKQFEFDVVIDVRGLGATNLGRLRGVRGELVWLHCPSLRLNRPVRLMHPRHRVYVVPRPGNLFVIGASEIESEDRSPVSLRSAVELMVAAQSVLPALAEARIVHMEANLRPALPDNMPLVHCETGLLAINGLFRHGWLLAPALAQDGLSAQGVKSFEFTSNAATNHA